MGGDFKVACLVNTLGPGNIPVENFAAINHEVVEKHLIVFQQTQSEAEAFINEVYPGSNLYVHSCLYKGSKNKLGAFQGLIEIVRKIRPQVIHVHHTGSAIATSVLRIFMNLNLVTTIHNSFKHYSLVQKTGYTFACVMSKQVVCNSRNTCKSLPGFIRSKKKKVIYNGVNFGQIDETLKSEFESNSFFRIGTVCRMTPQKDIDTLIRGFAHFVNLTGGVLPQLDLVGDGPELSRLKELAKTLGVAEKVQFTGEVSRSEVYNEMAEFDVFVVSSRWEGFCNAMVEAAAIGNPIVATNIEPLPEVIGEENAMFFNVGDYEGLGNNLKKLFDDPELRKKIGVNAKKYVRSKYSLDKSANEYEGVYKRLGEVMD